MVESQFTWVKAHKDIVDWLKVRKDKQQEIVDLIIDLGIKGIEDQDENGNRIPLTEIDPFTFFSSVYKYSKKGTILLQEIAKRINSYPLPTDVSGLPTANPVNARLFPYKPNRSHNEINRLWDFFYKALDDRIENEDFNDILKIENIAIVKITEVLFYVKPDKYLCINGPTIPYIRDVLGISPEFETYSEYMNILDKIKAKTRDPFYKISYDAWVHKENLSNYWVFQGNPKYYDVVGALNSNSLDSWLTNAHRDKIKTGDKVIVWMTGQERGCYALAEITSEPHLLGLGKGAEYWKTPPENKDAIRSGLKISYNLADKPILWDSIKDHPKLKNLNVGNQGTNFKATKEQYEALEKLITEETIPNEYVIDEKYNDDEEGVMKKPLNLILYGPPGTGKTYNTVNKALEILGIDTSGKGRAEIKQLFDDKMKEGQIVFTTFHQSMSYEDFVEGIKPSLIDEDNNDATQLSYKIEDGIIKQICVKAKHNIYKSSIEKPIGSSMSRDVLFSKAYDEFLEQVRKQFEESSFYMIHAKKKSELEIVNISNNLNLEVRHTSSDLQKSYIVSKQRLLKLFLAFESIDSIKKIIEDINKVIGGANYTSYWAVLNKLYPIAEKLSKETPDRDPGSNVIDFDSMKTLVEDFNITKNLWNRVSNEKQSRFANYVLIIDEINRGNVAQIFGELITLIEEDKRLGNPEALEVTLPYSKEKFGVPPNLYIIGTMNTADRSIEALDTALRRRFCFNEMYPRYDLPELDKEISGISLKDLLKLINDRIEKLIDKDHMIGHSYFMAINNSADLKEVFQNKINPLLQEYFYGDLGKIGLVLGAGFFEHEGKQNNETQVSFASFNDYEDEELSSRPVYRLKNVIHMDDTEFEKVLATLMGKAFE